MLVRQLVQHLQDTAPGTARVVIAQGDRHVAIDRARVETIDGQVVVVVYLADR